MLLCVTSCTRGANVEAFPICPILMGLSSAHPLKSHPLILSSFGFQRKTPFGLMQATCFMAANDTMAFKLNTDSIANSILVGTARRLLSKSVLQPQRIASRLSPNITLLESDNMQSHGGNWQLPWPLPSVTTDESGARCQTHVAVWGERRTLFDP